LKTFSAAGVVIMIIESLNGIVEGKRSKAALLRRCLDNYRRDESGALLVFGLMLVITMLIIGGFAVNMMRYERVRVDLSQTLDRAALAAASLSQTLDPEEVVKDYMKKSDMLPLLKEVKVTSTANGRIVEANARVDVPFFMAKMIGVDDLPAYAGSKARQDITDLEIIMVLDISGSMSEPDGTGSTKIVALRKAAKEFVAQMITTDSMEHVSIGIVPYNANVNLGPDLIAKYTVVDATVRALSGGHAFPSSFVPNPGMPHGRTNIHCVDLPDSLFNSRAISRVQPLVRTAYNDPNNITRDGNVATSSSGNVASGSWRCGRSSYSGSDKTFVSLPTNDKAKLDSVINGLPADGNTSITLGMRWGLALLDPSARGMYNEFVGGGKIPAVFAGRPYDYSKQDALKVIVLMTDGYHFEHERVLGDDMAVDYRSGLSPIWRDVDGNLSIAYARANLPPLSRVGNIAWPAGTGPLYWVPHLTTSTSDGASIRNAWRTTAYKSGSTNPVNLTWQEVWALKKPDWVIWHMYARAIGGTSSSARNSEYTSRSNAVQKIWKTRAEMDAMLQKSCDLAKDMDGSDDLPIVIFGIAFNAPPEGQGPISQCATKAVEPYYFAVEPGGMTISEAFSTIGSTINNLRLTQ
jgi:Flp pilus assembly protein TadG